MSIPSLRRREFVTLLGSGVAWPLVAHARDAAKVPTIGVLWHAGSPSVPYNRLQGPGLRRRSEHPAGAPVSQ
jgi:hypothetical protein